MGMTNLTTTPLSRRRFFGMAGLASAGVIAGSSVLSGCSQSSSGPTTIRFLQNKPEVIGYFDALIKTFNESQRDVVVVHDSTPTPLIPQFVRGAPPDLAMYNYNLETSNFLGRGALSNLAALPEAATIDPNVQSLVNQFATFKSEVSALPYSITAAGVIYNKQLFEQVGVTVPTTWSELMTVCEAFKSKGILPVYQTDKDTWTLQQGLFDYVSGSNLDVSAFFAQQKQLGPGAGPDASVSFTSSFKDAAAKMIALLAYTNPDAPSRSYSDGNAAFAGGKAAMYLQGPWAIGEVVKINPKAQLGTFAMPSSEDKEMVKVRVNLDLALWIPNASPKQAAAQTFLRWLLQPQIQNTYNADNLAWSTTKDAPPITDAHEADIQPLLAAKKFYQGAGTYMPGAIPLGNYLQEFVINRNADAFLTKLDTDWARYAKRTAV
jgi:raffinose/stachyose/melibiose transport system substrate-binding protein